MITSRANRQKQINKIVFDYMGSYLPDGIKTHKDIQPEHHIVNDLDADSLDEIEMIMALEEEMDVEISDEAAEKMKTMADVYRYFDA